MKNNKITSLVVSFVLMVCSFGILTLGVYSWYNGQAYMGKTMSYSRTMYIGSSSPNITNYYGHIVGEALVYDVIPPEGFENNNLVPGSSTYLKTIVENDSESFPTVVNVYLQNVTYDAQLHDYLYFGTTEPDITKDIYKESAIYNSQTDSYKIASVPLILNYSIEAGGELDLHWYVKIDTDAGNEIMAASINLGIVVIG